MNFPVLEDAEIAEVTKVLPEIGNTGATTNVNDADTDAEEAILEDTSICNNAEALTTAVDVIAAAMDGGL